MNRETLAKLLAAASLVLVLGMVLLFAGQQQARMQAAVTALDTSVDPANWAERYPQHYASFQRTAQNYGATTHGGSEPLDQLVANPFRVRAFAGNAFAREYKAARGHHFALQDQRDSARTREVVQPAGCINCHAAEAPRLIAELGWEALHALDYAQVQPSLHVGTSCTDCHAPDTMALTITRPALLNALQAQGIDTASLSRQDMRTYVCAQCHVEYYFSSEGKQLTLPWTQGRRLENIEAYYDALGFSDWTHPETGAALLKVQHPETELQGTGIHATQGVTCVDCHMPKVEEQGVRISDHWIRSPLMQIQAACLGCHRRDSAESLGARVVAIQDATVAGLHAAETEIAALIDAIVAARAAGASAAELELARTAHRRAQLRWDFIDAENSTGFHSALEARRLLDAARELARTGRASLE